MVADEDFDGEVGPLDIGAMEQILRTFLDADGLVDESASGFDSYLDPAVVSIRFEDGLEDAEWCRFDVRWFRTGCYSFHYVDARDVNYRYDCHPKTGAPDRHFHPPPDAPSRDPRASCIEVREPVLVARAVHRLWRRALENGSPADLNTATDPP